MAEGSKKILKTRKQEIPPTQDVGGDQLQPGAEDGVTLTEVVAEEKKENPVEKRRALSTRERGQQKHQQPGLSYFYDCENFLPWGYKWLKLL